ncbi:MAG: hypothetical protein FVQ84_06060 [Planctomycetes bacterium]|nr:hypothetical protein [Planctomycetota bacterium]
MRRIQSNTSSIGQITCGITLKTLVLETIGFVHDQLPAWRDDPNRTNEQSENKLNLQLCKFLDSRARKVFPMVCFYHEEYQAGRRSVDLSASLAESKVIEAKIYSIYDTILVLEGKRIPAPSSDREKEYVTGTTSGKISGGIQRFKLGLHGAKHNLVAMIGYVQDRSACHWHKKINGWISELVSNLIGDGCIWTADEILKAFKRDTSRGIDRYLSIHSRTDDLVNHEIELHHLWITIKMEN